MKITVQLAERSYPILIESGCLMAGQPWCAAIHHQEVIIVTNQTVAPLYLDALSQALKATNRKLLNLTLADGEAYKQTDTLMQVYDFLLTNNIGRQAVLIALGGGVIGDLTGYAAATYQRGIDFIQVPTTLLSQVDSSVGGKTGINHPLGKNMIGAFKQPLAVIIDPQVLHSLPQRELSAGLAEVIKYGLIFDADFFDWLEMNMQRLLNKDVEALTEAIARSCQIKADIVALDETEQGMRALLNFGHTFGHAIETEMGYGQWLHGEAVAAGMVMACDLSVRHGYIEPSVLERCKTLLTQAQLPLAPPKDISPDQFMALMMRDKKVASGQLRLVLLTALGKATLTGEYQPEYLKDCLAHFCHSLS